jgi:pimeloyl-ACP methyl ester carboxylesterase
VARPGAVADVVEIPGPWEHRYVAANGARFHLADTGPSGAPLVLLLHGFPEFWWAWRAQLPALADAGFRAAAMDLRGYGGSDKTPRGYDPITLAQDVSGVVKALGERSAVLVGHGWGGYVGWATSVLHPREVTALGTVAAPHPLTLLRGLWPGPATRDRGRGSLRAVRHLLAMQTPMLPERRLADPSGRFLAAHLRAWSDPASGFPDEHALATYSAAFGLWPAPHCALEYDRWLFRSRVRADGRHFDRVMREPVTQPVLLVNGASDQALCDAPAGRRGSAHPPVPGSATGRPSASRSAAHVTGPFRSEVIPGAGHFPHEEQPAAFTALLLDWLSSVEWSPAHR